MASIEEIKARLQQLTSKTNKPKDIWKPKDEHEIRLVPYPYSDDPIIELHFHYDIGENAIRCPKDFGEECAICDFGDKLRSWKDDRGQEKSESTRKSDWEIFKKIQAKQRWFVPMIERTNESEGVKFFGLNYTHVQQLYAVCIDADYNEDREDGGGTLVLVSPTKGLDIHVSFQKPNEKGNTKKFANTVLKERKKCTALAPSKDASDEIVKSVKHIDAVYPKIPSDEVRKIFLRFASGGFKEEEGRAADPDLGTEKYVSKIAPLPAGGKSIDDAFKDLMSGKEESAPV